MKLQYINTEVYERDGKIDTSGYRRLVGGNIPAELEHELVDYYTVEPVLGWGEYIAVVTLYRAAEFEHLPSYALVDQGALTHIQANYSEAGR